MKALISQMEEEVRNAHGISDLLQDRVCKLKRCTESLSDQAASSYGFSEDDDVLIAVSHMAQASGAMYEAMRHAQFLMEYLDEAKANLRKAQKGIE